MADLGADRTWATSLADALCARLCHEFAGPLGTLMGTLELIAEDPAMTAEALPLASGTAIQMVLRLRLLRAAWAGDCGPLDAASLGALAAGLPPRVRAKLEGLQGEFPAPLARVLANMLLLAVEALPRGGAVSLSGHAKGDILLTVAGAGARWPTGLPDALANPARPPTDDPRHVQAPLLAHLAQAAGLRLSLLLPAATGAPGAAPLLLTAA